MFAHYNHIPDNLGNIDLSLKKKRQLITQKSLKCHLIIFICAVIILTTEWNLSSEIDDNTTLATEVGVVGKSIAETGASTLASIMAAQLIVQPRADVDVASREELSVDNITVCCISN